MFDKLQLKLKGRSARAFEKAQAMLRDFNEAIPTMKALGLTVGNMSFNMGIPPQIGATFTGTIDAIERQRIHDLMERNAHNKVVTGILEALRTAATCKEQLSAIGFTGLKLDVKLGILPSVDVRLLAAPPESGVRSVAL